MAFCILVYFHSNSYGDKKTGTIPPKSTLHFEIELKAVSWKKIPFNYVTIMCIVTQMDKWVKRGKSSYNF